jgi:hypothetical protein
METDGSGFKVVASTGYMPMASVLVAGDRLYGTTVHGVGTSLGTLFTVRTDGTGFTKLRDLTMPYGGLVLSGTTLLGTTTVDFDRNEGTVFMIKTDGSRFTVLRAFNRSDGAGPTAGLVLSSNTVYGTTRYGGTDSKGLVFKLSLPVPSILRPPQSQTAELGSTVRFRVSASSPWLTCQWFFNDTNAITGVTTTWLELTNVQASHIGSYTVTIAHDFGSVTSYPALLNVIPAVERRPVPAVSLTGMTGNQAGVDCRDSLDSPTSWQTAATMTLTGTSQHYFDTSAPLSSERYYRAWLNSPSSEPPSLSLHLVPAITLTGTIGGKLRVDAINQIGPIDAWFTLDTITLTNTSQLYFDITAPDQPPRLYRLSPVP